MKTRDIIEAARRYAESQSSDPFAFNRALSHIHNGVAYADIDGSHYDAEYTKETRKTVTGEEFTVTAFKNVRRA